MNKFVIQSCLNLGCEEEERSYEEKFYDVFEER